jgi:hypothetical protein
MRAKTGAVAMIGAEQGPAADALQPALVPRSRFQPRLKRGVRLLNHTGAEATEP